MEKFFKKEIIIKILLIVIVILLTKIAMSPININYPTTDWMKNIDDNKPINAFSDMNKLITFILFIPKLLKIPTCLVCSITDTYVIITIIILATVKDIAENTRRTVVKTFMNVVNSSVIFFK